MTEEIKQLSKAQLRAKRYYEAHKSKILEKAKAKRISKLPEPEKVLMYNEIVDGINNNTEMKDTTKQIYLKTLKRINKVLQYNNYVLGLSHIDDTIKIINSLDEFSINTIKLIYQTILKIIDLFDLNIDKKPYVNQFELLKIKSTDENKHKQQTIKLPTFQQYINDVKNKFGEDSKMYVLARLYDVMTLRDDFSNLIIVSSLANITDDTDKNYIYIPKNKSPVTIRINSYKTDKKYGVIHKNLPIAISKLIKNYAEDNDLNEGDYLFGRNVGAYISQKNKEISYEGISQLRHIKVSDLLNRQDITAEQRLELSNSMMHSPNIQEAYKRNNTITIIE
jgi:hypothetical protein